jgi:hypothetical protein
MCFLMQHVHLWHRTVTQYMSKLLLIHIQYSTYVRQNLFSFLSVSIHCYKTFRRIPPPSTEAQDSSCWVGENDCFIWAGNLRPQVPKFSVITGNFRRFLLWKKEGCACWDDLSSSGLLFLSSTPRPRLPYINNEKIYSNKYRIKR